MRRGLGGLPPAVREWFDALRRAHPRATRRMEGDRRRRPRPDPRPDRLGEDPRRVPVGDRPARDRAAAVRAAARTRVLYISPLRALAVDIEKNLRAPLAGIRTAERPRRRWQHAPEVAIRTGDTPPRPPADRSAAPPDVLITTPESLYLMLTSSAREIRGVRWVIVDEIHAMAATKRGAIWRCRSSDSRRSRRPRRSGSASRRRSGRSRRPRGSSAAPSRPTAAGHDRRRRAPQADGAPGRGARRGHRVAGSPWTTRSEP